MTHLDLSKRDRTVERLLIRGGFNRDTFIAASAVIKGRATSRDGLAAQKAPSAPPSHAVPA